MSRRTTLGPLSTSQVNARSSSARVSLGPAMLSMHDTAPAKPRQSIANTGRLSMAPQPRESTGISRKSSVRPDVGGGQDPRPVKDKNFVNQNIRMLVNFLTDHNYDYAISPRILTRPAVKDFANIVQFLFRKIDPNFNMTGKFEDEVIQMFKVLGYPFNISKTSLVAVGSPHTWPALLAAVVWVIELLTVDDQLALAEEAAEGSHEDIMSDEKAFFQYLSRAYKYFLSGDDQTCLQIVEEYVLSFEGKNRELTSEIERIAEENEALAREIQQVENQRSYLPELRRRKADYEGDLDKFQKLIAQLQEHKDGLVQKVDSRSTEVEKLRNTIVNVDNDISSLKQRIAIQELSAEDVERMGQERKRLSDSLHQASEQRHTMQRRAWESEVELNRVLEGITKQVHDYNALAEELQLVPITAKNARGQNYEIAMNPQGLDGRSSSKILSTNIPEKLLRMLSTLKDQFADMNAGIRQNVVAKTDEQEELEGRMREKREELALLEAKLRRAEENYRREKEAQDSLMGTQNEELSELEERLAEFRDTSEEESQITAFNRRIVESKTRLVVQREEHERLKTRLMEAIMEVAAKCADHKERVSQRLGEVQEKFRQRLEGLLMGENINASKQRFRDPSQQQHFTRQGQELDETFGSEADWHDERNQHGIGVGDISIGMSPIPSVKNGFDDPKSGSRFEPADASMGQVAMELSMVAPEPRLHVVKNLADVIDRAARDDTKILKRDPFARKF